MASQVSPVEVTFVTTDGGEGPYLGYEYERVHPDNENYGNQVWVWVQMTGGAAAAGEVVERAAGSDTFVVVQGAATTTRASAVGVAQHAIAENSYGYVLARGHGTLLADGSVTANADVVPDASGEVTDFADGEEERVIALALDTDTGASTTVFGFINCL